MRIIRSLVYLVWLYMTLPLVGGFYFIPAVLGDRKAARAACRDWSRLALWGLRVICGGRFVVEGREHLPTGGPVLVAAKHQAMIDTLGPFTLFSNHTTIMKKELVGMPVFGWYAVKDLHIPVDRDAHASALKTMLRAARAEKDKGRPVVIFPEGTRQVPGAPPDYKPGVAALYRDLGVPCVPVALDTGRVWPAKGWIMTPGVMTWRFLPPIPPGLPREAFMQRLEHDIETASNALLAQPNR
jgi:1-acyl-sn-glycerol-3-phosphate acyltransferase